MGRIRRLFKGTLPMFSALWLWMMLVLLWLNSEGQSARMGASMQSYRWSVEYQYSEIWNGSAAETKKPVILTWRLMEEPLYSIGGITQTRVYDRRGRELARRLAAELSGEAARCGEGCTLDAWTADAFANADALVYVGAAGIAVRAVAPYAGNKASDPAVVAVDECGRFAVPLLSGHLGGANRLARRIGAVCGALPVITTATDANGAFAVDEWAVRQGCCVLDVPRIKRVSAKILAGGTAVLRSPWPVAGTPPAGVAADGGAFDFELTVHSADAGALRLVPRIAVLGVGCRKGIGQQAMEEAFAALLAQSGLCAEAFYKVCSIDLKRDEPGLRAFCAAHGFAFETFSAAQLAAVAGRFSSSGFVQSVTGVDNVCERSAVLGSGGTLYCKKQAGGGVTMAAAMAPFAPDWRWQDE